MRNKKKPFVHLNLSSNMDDKPRDCIDNNI